MKLTETEVRPPETKQQGRKRNVAFRDKIPALITVVEYHTKPTATLLIF